jgi:hypothetical protein
MNSKTFVGGLIGGIVAFLLGWIIYGMLLMDYFSSNMIQYEGLMKAEPVLWMIFLGGLAWAMLTAYVINASGINNAAKGAMCGAILYMLISLGVNLMFHAQMNMMNTTIIVVDVLASIIMGGFVGAAIGWWNGRGEATAA